MMLIEELTATITRLRRGDLEAWIRDELVAPTPGSEPPAFSEMECARVRLLCTLTYELEVEGETLPLVVSLLDQLYETRQKLLSLTAAVTAEDPAVRRAILARIGAAEPE
ncbi:MAG: hypothetical protein U1E34_11325 [Amaricoccus sp.]